MGNRIRNHEIFSDGKFSQILILSFGFMLLFSAFQTTCITEKTVLESVKRDDSSFNGDGYVSLCIIYAAFSIASWFAPSVVAVCRPKWSLIGSAAIYIMFVAQFNRPYTWLLYLTSVLIGIGAAVLWTAQGNLLTLASTPETISRNSGVFWAINQCSLFFGNLFVFFKFQGKTHIDEETRIFVFIVLTVVCCLGVITFLFLRDLREDTNPEKNENETDESKEPCEIGLAEKKNDSGMKNDEGCESSSNKSSKKEQKRPLQLAVTALKEAVTLFITPYMLLLSVASIFTGFGQTFWSGVFPSSVGFTAKFGQDAKRLVGLIGIFTGIGEVLGGTIFGLLGSKTVKKGRSPVVFLGLLISSACYILVYVNIPDKAPLGETQDVSYIDPPQAWIALLSAFLLGLGDACYQTQLFAIFGSVYADRSAAAFAIFKFTQSTASAVGFFSSSYLGMSAQTLALLISAILAFLSILYVEVDTKRKQQDIIKDNKELSKSNEIAP